MATHGRRVAPKAVPKGLVAPRFADGGDIGDPMGEAYPPGGGDMLRKAGSGFAQGLIDWASTPGRAYKEGLAPGEETTWGAGTALGMLGIGAPVAMAGGVGRAGIFGGRLAQTADHAKLARAEEMSAAGADPVAIHAQTGWFKGSDDKWRFEISDHSSRLNPNTYANGLPETAKPALIAGEIWHPELYAAYPELRNAKIRIEQGNNSGRYFPNSGGMGDVPVVHVNATNPQTARSVALHEIQHDIQHREGFAKGADFERVGMENYVKSAGEQEAANVQRRLFMTPEERAASPPWETETVPRDQQIVNMSYGSAPERFASGGLIGNSNMGFGPSQFGGFGGAMPQAQQWQGGQGGQSPSGGMQHYFGGFNPQQQGGFMPQGLMGNAGMGQMPMSGFGMPQQNFPPQMSPQGLPAGAMNQLAANPGTMPQMPQQGGFNPGFAGSPTPDQSSAVPDAMPMQQPYPGDVQSQPPMSAPGGFAPSSSGFAPDATNFANQMAANPGAQAAPRPAAAPPASFPQQGSFRPGFAVGGMPTHIPLHLRSMARQTNPGSSRLPKGLIASPVAGRTDRINVSAKPNSYVIPADVVSGIGQGNTLAGGRIFDAMLKQGPYGSAGAPAMKVHGSTIPKAPKAFADGGLAPPEGEDVPIIVAGGEYYCDPEIVAAIGGGDVNKGHEILDNMVTKIREQTIKQMQQLPGPQK